MTDRTFFLCLWIIYFTAIGISSNIVGFGMISSPPNVEESTRLGTTLIILGLACLCVATQGNKINFFPKAPGPTDIPTA